jgi:septal ring factor EnvC (AmiA/AmiB activator)
VASLQHEKKNVLRKLAEKAAQADSLALALAAEQRIAREAEEQREQARAELESLRREFEQQRRDRAGSEDESARLREYVEYLTGKLEGEQERISELERFRAEACYEVRRLRSSRECCGEE